ncbi:branched-chain amino acid aminotransferase [uncultured Algimonas sp.]|uniref:branched-chain amino acid aminotransferase n=1 Tax=uncultured Algimonas sp. TaxID=1547920 RepID=UPI002619C945|nr:branched-chain amino acid aminotransferase [uncultured Algimonas sp.]
MLEKPYHDRDGHIWVDGEFIDWRDAKVHVLTHSLHYGSAVFEGDRAYEGEIFRLTDHSARLRNSADLLGYEIPYTTEQIDQACVDALARSGLGDAYVRPVAWRGSEMMGVASKNNVIHLAVACWHWGNYFPDKMAGIRLMISDWKRPAPDTIPCKAKAAGLYMICTLSKDKAAAGGWDDALMYDYRGRVAECTGAHIFFVRDGELHTPTNDILLEGITYDTVIQLAEKRGITVHRRDIYPSEMPHFEGAFVVGTAAEVTPVREIQGIHYRVGDTIKELAADYDALVRGKISL